MSSLTNFLNYIQTKTYYFIFTSIQKSVDLSQIQNLKKKTSVYWPIHSKTIHVKKLHSKDIKNIFFNIFHNLILRKSKINCSNNSLKYYFFISFVDSRETFSLYALFWNDFLKKSLNHKIFHIYPLDTKINITLLCIPFRFDWPSFYFFSFFWETADFLWGTKHVLQVLQLFLQVGSKSNFLYQMIISFLNSLGNQSRLLSYLYVTFESWSLKRASVGRARRINDWNFETIVYNQNNVFWVHAIYWLY